MLKVILINENIYSEIRKNWWARCFLQASIINHEYDSNV